MRPRRDISSQRKESHQSHWTAVLFAHSRWRDFLSLCLYYAVVCGFIRDWVGTAQNRTRVIVYITSVQIVGYGCLPLLSSRCFPESLSSMTASGWGFPRASPAGLPDAWRDGWIEVPHGLLHPPCPFVGHSVPNNGNRERHPDEITHSALLFSSRIGVERRSRNLHRIGASRASCDMAAWGIRHPGGSLQASRCAVERPCALLRPAPARHPQCRHILHANHP